MVNISLVGVDPARDGRSFELGQHVVDFGTLRVAQTHFGLKAFLEGSIVESTSMAAGRAYSSIPLDGTNGKGDRGKGELLSFLHTALPLVAPTFDPAHWSDQWLQWAMQDPSPLAGTRWLVQTSSKETKEGRVWTKSLWYAMQPGETLGLVMASAAPTAPTAPTDFVDFVPQAAPQGPPQAAPQGPPMPQAAPQGPPQAAPQGPPMPQAAPQGPPGFAPQGPPGFAPQAAPQGPPMPQAAPQGPPQAAPQGPPQWATPLPKPGQ